MMPVTEPLTHDFQLLLAHLTAPVPSVRRGAARELAEFPGAAAILCDRLEREISPSVRSVILASLVRLQTPTVAARLLALLQGDDLPLRNGAISALRAMPEATMPFLKRLLADDDESLRRFAVTSLVALSPPMAPDWLAEVIRMDPDHSVRAAAADGLASVSDPP